MAPNHPGREQAYTYQKLTKIDDGPISERSKVEPSTHQLESFKKFIKAQSNSHPSDVLYEAAINNEQLHKDVMDNLKQLSNSKLEESLSGWKKKLGSLSRNPSRESSRKSQAPDPNPNPNPSRPISKNSSHLRSMKKIQESKDKGNLNISQARKKIENFNSLIYSNSSLENSYIKADNRIYDFNNGVPKSPLANPNKGIEKINTFIARNTIIEDSSLPNGSTQQRRKSSVFGAKKNITTIKDHMRKVRDTKGNKFHSASVPQKIEELGFKQKKSVPNSICIREEMPVGNYRGTGNNPYNVSYKEKFGNVADSMSDYDRSLNDLSVSKSVPQIWGIGGPEKFIAQAKRFGRVSSKFDSKSIDNVGIEKSENVIGSYELTTSNPDKDKKSSSFHKGGQHGNGGTIWDLRDFTIEENNENSSFLIDTGKRGGSSVVSGRFSGNFVKPEEGITTSTLHRRIDPISVGIQKKYRTKSPMHMQSLNPKVKLSDLNSSPTEADLAEPRIPVKRSSGYRSSHMRRREASNNPRRGSRENKFVDLSFIHRAKTSEMRERGPPQNYQLEDTDVIPIKIKEYNFDQ
jgi:general stress protein YciG